MREGLANTDERVARDEPVLVHDLDRAHAVALALDRGLVDLEDLDLEELRRRRSMCHDLDLELSYYRRMLHGKMDLLAFEMRRRAGEEEATLLEALPRILAEGGSTSPTGLATRSTPVAIPDIPSPGRRLVDRALQDDFLARLPSMNDDEVGETHDFLAEVEADVSRQRARLHEVLDGIQEELTRRYRHGSASPGE